MEYYVEIVRIVTADECEEVVKRMGPMSERKAERVEMGALHNLNHDDYFTRVVPAEAG